MKVYRVSVEQVQRELAIFQSLLRSCPENQVQQIYMTLAGLRAELIEMLQKRLLVKRAA